MFCGEFLQRFHFRIDEGTLEPVRPFRESCSEPQQKFVGRLPKERCQNCGNFCRSILAINQHVRGKFTLHPTWRKFGAGAVRIDCQPQQSGERAVHPTRAAVKRPVTPPIGFRSFNHAKL